MKISTDLAYDITKAFITDEKTTIKREFSHHYHTNYILTKDNLQLVIYVPHGAPGYDWLDDYYYMNNGDISLYRNSYNIAYYHTKHNVGRAMNKSKYNPIRLITRALSPRFFNLIDMADARINNKIKTTDNTDKIYKTILNIAISKHLLKTNLK